MKSFWMLLLATSTTILFSCNKTKTNTDSSLTGTWEIRKSSAAMMPTGTIYPAGNGTTINFLSNNTYKAYDKGTLTKSGSYKVVNDSTFEQSVCMVTDAEKFRKRIIYDGVTSEPKQFFHRAGNMLIIKAGCYAVDAGTTLEYDKISTED